MKSDRNGGSQCENPKARVNRLALRRIVNDRLLRVWLMCVIHDDLCLEDTSCTAERAAELLALKGAGQMLYNDMREADFRRFLLAQREYRDLCEEHDRFIGGCAEAAEEVF